MAKDPGAGDGPGEGERRTRLFERAARLVGFGAWECDLATERLTWTDGVYDLFGLPRGTPLARQRVLPIYDEDSRCALEQTRAQAIAHGGTFSTEARLVLPDGATRWIRIAGEVAVEDGRPSRLFGAKQDITAERDAWSRLRQLADHDPLTGLANRRLFDARYRSAVEGDGDPAMAALALVDLDRFKPINDAFGHAAGDECLRRAAAALRRALPEAAIVARIGGDEFAALLRAPLGVGELRKALKRASLALSRPLVWERGRIAVGASIGAAMLWDRSGRPPARAFAEADEALYRAKAAGRGAVRVFGDGHASAGREGAGEPAARAPRAGTALIATPS